MRAQNAVLKAMPADDAPTLTGTANHVEANLQVAHKYLDAIELSLFPPADDSSGMGVPASPDLDSVLTRAANSSATLATRLEQMAKRVGDRA